VETFNTTKTTKNEMIRTQHLLAFKSEVSKINTHQSQIKFIFEQFLIDNNAVLNTTESRPQFSVSIFKDNQYSTEFNTEIKDLAKSMNDSKAFVFKSIYVLLYTRFEVFLRDEYYMGKYELQEDIPEMGKFKIPETFFENLNIQLQQELSTTFEYIRLRRNAIVHRTEDKISQGEISSFINANGKKLNEFWNGEQDFHGIKGIKIKKIDFTNKHLEQFDELELIDFFNLYRILAEVIDRLFVTKFTRDNWIDYIIQKQKNRKTPLAKEFETIKKEIKWFSRDLINLDLNVDELQRIYEGVV